MEFKPEGLTPYTEQSKTFTVKEGGLYYVFGKMLHLIADRSYSLEDLLTMPPAVKLNRAQRRELDKRQRKEK